MFEVSREQIEQEMQEFGITEMQARRRIKDRRLLIASASRRFQATNWVK